MALMKVHGNESGQSLAKGIDTMKYIIVDAAEGSQKPAHHTSAKVLK
jgi:hypothetical protein